MRTGAGCLRWTTGRGATSSPPCARRRIPARRCSTTAGRISISDRPGPSSRRRSRRCRRGRGVALVRGLPREGLDEKSFELLTWAIGLHAGVGRPQGKASHYMSAVRDAGTAYRTGTGRGYSSNAELDFHTDSADVVGLTCYNKAAAGGMSITTSSLGRLRADGGGTSGARGVAAPPGPFQPAGRAGGRRSAVLPASRSSTKRKGGSSASGTGTA